MTKNKYIKFRVTEDEFTSLMNEAKLNDMSLSDTVRYKLTLPIKRDRQQLIFHVARIGNNVNQLARAMNTALKIQKLTRAEMQTALTRLLCVQAELKNLRIDFWEGELGNVNKGW